VLQRVAVCCSALQRVAACCSVLQYDVGFDESATVASEKLAEAALADMTTCVRLCVCLFVRVYIYMYVYYMYDLRVCVFVCV